MPTYCLDTWFFIALWNRFDGHHRAALRLERLLSAGNVVTHEGVLSEVLAYFSESGTTNRHRAVASVREILRTARVESVDRELFRRSVDLYAARPDKGYSLTDCTTMVLMRDRGITHVLTNDHHFRQEGFTVLSDSP